eukprot:COSAG01_NODE_3147_length_6515_cov_3.711347_2_plen_272_part_00
MCHHLALARRRRPLLVLPPASYLPTTAAMAAARCAPHRCVFTMAAAGRAAAAAPDCCGRGIAAAQGPRRRAPIGLTAVVGRSRPARFHFPQLAPVRRVRLRSRVGGLVSRSPSRGICASAALWKDGAPEAGTEADKGHESDESDVDGEEDELGGEVEEGWVDDEPPPLMSAVEAGAVVDEALALVGGGFKSTDLQAKFTATEHCATVTGHRIPSAQLHLVADGAALKVYYEAFFAQATETEQELERRLATPLPDNLWLDPRDPEIEDRMAR